MSDDQKKIEAQVDSPKSPAERPARSPRRAPAKKAAPKAPVADTPAVTASGDSAEKAPARTAKKTTAKKPAAPKSTAKAPAKAAAKAADDATAPAKNAKVQRPVALDLDGAPFDVSPADAAQKPQRAPKKSVTPKATAKVKTPEGSAPTEEKTTDKRAPAPKASQNTRRSASKVNKTTKDATASTLEGKDADAPAADSTQKAKTQPKGQRNTAQPAKALSHEAEKPVTVSESAPAEGETSALQGEDGAGGAPRKSRRGRRGGRGRGRGKGKQAQAALEAPSDDTPLAMSEVRAPMDDMGGMDEMDDVLEQTEDDTDETVTKAAPQKSGRGKTTKAAKGKEAKADAEPKTDGKPGRRKMFISVVPGEQVEVALVEEGAILEYYLEMMHQAKVKGNIYKGVVHNVDTNLQAAFVNYGSGKNGFLQIDEIHPEYYLSPHETAKGKKFPPIQKVIKAGQEVLVQVVKEPTGNKGAFLTTWLSLAGRFLVLTPGQEQIGVSRKVDNDEERSRLREMMNGIEPGEGLGVIVRTVSAGTSKTTLKNDLQYLKRAWKEIRRKGTSDTAPCLIYQESNLAERAVRDYLTDDVCEVWVDHEDVAESLRETVSLLFPRKKDLVRVHVDVRQTLWERFNIQRQLEQIYAREVHLPSGGRLVFDQTEALMAIDINSGKISGKANFESMALKTNLEAAEAIARHLRLRDIGGQVVIDFIEMRDKNHIRDVEKTLRNAMKIDRARHDVARMSSFGLMEIVRQRTGSSALAVTMEPCPCCNGTGIRRNMEWQSLQALRQIGRQARIPGAGSKCVFDATPELGMYLLNHKRDRLREMEQQLNVTIEIRIQP